MGVLTFHGVAKHGGNTPTRTTIAVIGCGPSGMFFCHAMEKLCNESNEKCFTNSTDVSSNQKQPQTPSLAEYDITCFERASSPGGVWRSADEGDNEQGTGMYDQLWMNGPSHNAEFYDYTFDEHFGKPVSVYLKRQDMLDYITARVAKGCPDFFEKFVKFQTEVHMVNFDESIRKFTVVIKDLTNGTISTKQFDKCIWACGDNGRRRIPQNLLSLFRNGGFEGDIIHSASTANMERYVKGKRILLIGGSYSAEDLALQSIKLGVKKVYICTRDYDATVNDTEVWPEKKVKILNEQIPVGITKGGRCIQFGEVEWSPPNDYTKLEDSDVIETEIWDIDTVIFCTGYSKNFDMLSSNLRELVDLPAYQLVALPSTWRPRPHPIDGLVGDHIKPGRVWVPTYKFHPNIYNGMLINNPNFLVLNTLDIDCVLFGSEVHAFATAKYVTGQTKMPDEADMRHMTQENILRFFDLPLNRIHCDENYYAAVVSKVKGYAEGRMSKKVAAIFDRMEQEANEEQIRLLCGVMRAVDYPDDIGTRDELNERGRTRFAFDWESGNHRSDVVFRKKDERKWKTFRDCEKPHFFYSHYTGTKAVKLERPWMQL